MNNHKLDLDPSFHKESKSDKETFVSITKVNGDIEHSVRTAISRVGGMESLVSKGENIYLKPNFVAPRNSSQGVTTDLNIIRVVAEEVRQCGGNPILFETPAIEFEKEKVYGALGVYEFAQKNGISIFNGPLDLITAAVPRGKVFHSIRVPKALHHAKIINLPKLKTHVSAKMTCAMKNLIGLLPNSEKRRVHILGVHSAIADLSKVFRPVLTIVDAVTCMEGDGPTYGDRIDLGLIIAGKNMIAVDKICSQIIGLPWEDVNYIRLSDNLMNQENIKVVGESIKDTCIPFMIPQKSSFYHLGSRMIHTLDIVFSKIFSKPFNQFLYSTGYLGTNPKIDRAMCNECGDCLEVCPIKDALEIENYKVNYKACIRCLNCFTACSQKAISVRGVSHPKK